MFYKDIIGDFPARSDYDCGKHQKPSVLLLDKKIIEGLYLYEDECDGIFRIDGIMLALTVEKVYPICYRENMTEGRVQKVRNDLYCYAGTLYNDDYYSPVFYSGLLARLTHSIERRNQQMRQIFNYTFKLI